MVEVKGEGARALTPIEARVMADLLGAGLESEEERIRSLSMARASYQNAKKRIYARGWLVDRYVVAPARLGIREVSFLVSRPFLEKVSGVAEELSVDRGTVVLWEGGHSLFGVLFHPDVAHRESLHRRVEEGAFGEDAFLLTVDATTTSVPIYFDFEGGWCHFARTGAPSRYPRPLPLAPPRSTLVPSPPLMDLLRRPYHAMVTGREPHLLGPAALPRSQRKLLQQGWVEWRPSLGVGRMPPYAGAQLSSLLLLHGVLRQGRELPALFQDLAGRSGVYPFLLASDGTHVLLGGLALGLEGLGGAPAEVRSRAPVFPTLQEYLEQIEFLREPLSTVQVHLLHRYDLLLNETSTIASTPD